MRAFLLFEDRDFDQDAPSPANSESLAGDLELERLFETMARGDKYLLRVVRQVVLASLSESTEIAYRQGVLKECIARSEVAREMYSLAEEALTGINKVSFLGVGFFSRENPELTLHRAVQQLRYLSEMLSRLREFGVRNSALFSSAGLARFFEMLVTELDPEYLGKIKEHLEQLRFRDGVLVGAELGDGHKGANYTIRTMGPAKQSWLKKAAQALSRTSDVIVIPERDEPGFRALEELRGRGINSAANAVARSSDHVLSFFSALRFELAFYIGCLNLHEALRGKGEPVCFPEPLRLGDVGMEAEGLYDASLSLRLNGRCVGNSFNADGKVLIVVTGVNRGGKSTFVRSVGQAQLMMQAGMYVAANKFNTDVRNGVFTHFKREEDKDMAGGKLEEELSRMSGIVEQISVGDLLILNESFASTNEREGSQIGRGFVTAMLDSGVKVFLVTHFYELASSFARADGERALFLRANREDDGARSFRLVEGEALSTVHGEDIYREIFGSSP